MKFDSGVEPTPDVEYGRQGRLGLVRLNRPKAINSLNTPMVRSMLAQLEAWTRDPEVATVALVGAGDRGLCAGGDVVTIRDMCLAGGQERERAMDFFRTEYRLDSAIYHYPKPFVAFMDGITMGGGIGIGAHAGIRLVTERSKIAMPETIIGFFPDVGGLHLLAEAPGELGTHAALSGATITGADAVAMGFADVLVDSATLPEVLERLVEEDLPPLEELGDVSPASPLLEQRGWIDECYAGDDPRAIVERLRATDVPAAQEAADNILLRSPFSVTVTLRALRRAERLGDLDAVLAQDAHLAEVFTTEDDMAEGIRAQLVDKDRTPRWRHPDLASVSAAEIDAVFAGLD